MVITASKLRENVYRILDQVLATGEPIEIERNGRRLLLVLSDQAVAAVVSAAGLTWTRDPFDRLIVADALAANTQLLTKDDTILRHRELAR